MQTSMQGPCPACGEDVEFLYATENVPYFADVLIIRVLCPVCGFRYVDTQVLSEKEPIRWELYVDDPEDLTIRVVRSTNGSIEIPELGVRIDPGPACEGFISNVEGILDRIEHVADSVLLWAEESEREKATEFKEKVLKVRSVREPFRIIIEDPSGNSVIFAEKAKKCDYIPEEDENEAG